MIRHYRRWTIGLVCLFALSPLLVGGADPATASTQLNDYKGKVVPLAEIVAKAGGQLDADAAPHWLALVGEDGKIYPLVKDSGSRMFFKDSALLRRPMRLAGRLIPGSQLLRVLAVRSYVKGELNEVYYWCDVCSIRRSEKNICECCGGPMVLREEPVKK
jgi:hypothetical protein